MRLDQSPCRGIEPAPTSGSLLLRSHGSKSRHTCAGDQQRLQLGECDVRAPWPARTRRRSVPTAGHRLRIRQPSTQRISRRTVPPHHDVTTPPRRLNQGPDAQILGKIPPSILASISSQHLESHRIKWISPKPIHSEFESCSRYCGMMLPRFVSRSSFGNRSGTRLPWMEPDPRPNPG